MMKKKSSIIIKGADKTFILLNKIWSNAYTIASGKTSPQIIQEVIRDTTSKENRTESITTAFVSYPTETNIQNTRPDGSAFPTVSFSKAFAPVYEWIDELSKPEYTNDGTELTSGNLVAKRGYIFYIDENDVFHWYYPRETITGGTWTVGTTTDPTIINVDLTKKVWDVVNMVIFNAGRTVKGHGVWGYWFDPNTDAKSLKMKLVTYTDITRDLLAQDYFINSTRGSGDYPYTYPSSYAISNWSFKRHNVGVSTISSDSDYDDKLFDAASAIAKDRAARLTSRLARSRWKGTIEIIGKKLTAGDLISLTDTSIGLQKEFLRINDVQHNISKNGWFTTVGLEEDEPEQDTIVDR